MAEVQNKKEETIQPKVFQLQAVCIFEQNQM